MSKALESNKDPIVALHHLSYHIVRNNQGQIDIKPTTQSQRRVLEELSKWEADRRNGRIDKIFPEIQTLANGAGCSCRTVNRTLKLFDGVLFKRISGKSGHKNNTYEVFDCLFQIMSYLSPKGFIKNWKRNEKWIREEIITYQDFVDKKARLSTKKCRTTSPPKCRTIKTLKSFSKRPINIRTQERAQSCEQHGSKVKEKEPLKFGKGVMFLKEVGVDEKEAIKFASRFVDDAWFEAKKDFWWFKKRHTIYNPIAFMISRAKEHTKRIFKI